MPRALLIALCAVLSSACSDKPSEADCDRLVEHMIDLELQAAEVSADESDETRAKIEADVGERSRRACLDNLPMSQVECGLAAETVADIARCDES